MSIANKILFIIVYLVAQTLTVFAQNQAITEPELMYRKQLMYGINLNSTGLGGLNFKMGWQKTDLVKKILDIELARIRDSKEARVYGASENPQRYTYDRIYMAFFLRTGYGRTITVTDRPYKNAFGLNFNYSFGLTTAILKPIYIDYLSISYDNQGVGTSYVSSVRYDPNIHNNPQNIIGNSAFFYGASNSIARFGAYGKASLEVRFSQFPDEFHNIEAGFTVDAFPEGLPLMANSPRQNLFFVFFVGYTYGLNL